MSAITFTEVTKESLPVLTEIMNYYVEHTTVTLRTIPVTIDDMEAQLLFPGDRYKSFLIVEEGNVIGYSSVMPWNTDPASGHTGVVGIYLEQFSTNKRIGVQAFEHLLAHAQQHNIANLIAPVSVESMPALKLFSKAGFKVSGHLEKVAAKFGRLVDVVYMQRLL